MDNNNFFNNFTVSSPEPRYLPAGWHKVRIVNFQTVEAARNLDGSFKKHVPEWQSLHWQLFVTFGGTKGEGTAVHRFNSQGFARYDEITANMTPDDIKKRKLQNIEGFACRRDDKGVLQRLIDPARTNQAADILNRFGSCVGIVGQNMLEGMQTAVDSKAELMILVAQETYDGKDSYIVKDFKAVKSAEVQVGNQDDLGFSE